MDFIVPINEIYVLNLTIPDGYKVEEMPKSVKVALEGNRGSLEYRVNPVGMTIQVISKIKINQTVFAPSEYFELKEFFDLIIEKHAEQIVLKKVQ